MPADHSTGSALGSRQGCLPAVHTLPVNFNSITNRKFLRIGASLSKPVMVKMEFFTAVVFNAGTLNQFRIGKTSAGAEIAALASLPAAAVGGTPYTPLNVGAIVLTADTDIFFGLNFTGTTITTGQGYFKASLEEINLTEPSQTSNIP